MLYEEKYRAKAIEYKESGHTFEELKEVFGISASTYYRWKRIQNTTGGCVKTDDARIKLKSIYQQF